MPRIGLSAEASPERTRGSRYPSIHTAGFARGPISLEIR